METRLLKYFVAVAEELHFGRAASKLHICQPPLSQQIMKFEDELGVKLFRRNKRSVELTKAGQCLLVDAKLVLSSIDQARINLQAIISGRGGLLNLGYIGPALEASLADIIGEYKNAYPEVQLSMVEMFTNAQLEAVRDGSLDLGAVRLFRHEIDDLESVLFHRESYSIVVPSDHRFAMCDTVDISDLGGEPLIFFPRESQPLLYDEWMNVFGACGAMPDILQEVSTKTAAIALVSAGLGVSIVPESLAARRNSKVVFKKMTGNFPSLEMHLIYKKGQDFPALNNFISVADDLFR